MDIKKIVKFLEHLLSKHWKKWTILVILAMFIYIGIVAYKYVYGPIYASKEVTAQRLEIKRSAYQQIMNTYSESQETVNELINKTYPDPFK